MNPFQVGDIVHHVKFGEGVVTRTPSNHDVYTGVRFPRVGQQDCQPIYLSYTPWPKANHERPIQDGWWVVSSGSETPMLREKRGNVCFDSAGHQCNLATHYTFHKFLGDSWK